VSKGHTARAAHRQLEVVSRTLGDEGIGLEARVARDDHMALKVWLRLLACSMQIETEVRKRLRAQFGTTLSRFDYLAQLHRHPEGLRMSALSRYLMVTGGNITGLTDEMEKEGLVARQAIEGDRRSMLLKLTPLGRRTFEQMATVHEGWLVELMSGLSMADHRHLHDSLGRLRMAVQAQQVSALKPPPRAPRKHPLAKDRST
jgi:DNA-binding MarR family transcriptional regulator